MSIHPTAIVSPEARLGTGVRIGPHSVVEAGAELGDHCVLDAQCVIRSHATLEQGVRIHPFAVIGDDPQVVGFDPQIASRVLVGARTTVREAVTIHRSMNADGWTRVGPDCYLMATSHVGHDCRLEAKVIMANGSMIGGHVTVGAHSFIGGLAGVHQFVRIGEGAMIGGTALVTRDVPPFSMAALHNDLIGLNRVGLRRRGFDAAAMADLKTCFRLVYFPEEPGDPRVIAAAIVTSGREGATDAGDRFLAFFAEGKRGFQRPRRRHD